MFKFKFPLYLAILIASAFPVLAVATTGTIDSTYKYGWSNNIGWINFAPESGGSYSGATISDTDVSGYAWSQNSGWISFNCSNDSSCGSSNGNWGVKNNGSGTLSGYAWGQNTGWIDFSGVSIDVSTGYFSGAAVGDVVANVVFSCPDGENDNCKVQTTWRPVSCGDGTCNGVENCGTCPADCGGCGGGGGGGIYVPTALPKPAVPEGGFSILVNGGAANSSSTVVTLRLIGGPDTVKVEISNNPNFKSSSLQDYQTKKLWVLSAGNGPKTVYVRFYNKDGGASDPISAKINLTNQPVSSTLPAVEKSASSKYNFIRNLQQGAISADVKELQKYLNNNGFIIAQTGPGSPGNESTYFGKLTKDALANFQKANGIPPTGFFGPQTRAFVNKK